MKSTRLQRLYSLSARIDTILFRQRDEEGQEPGGDLQQKIGAMAGGAAGGAVGARLPSIARRQARIDAAAPPVTGGFRTAKAANLNVNRKLSKLRTRGRGMAALGLGLTGAVAGHYVGKAFNPDSYV
ncbi:MAG: hypothetical protein QOE70_4042 [Chthoniobacter sp.]|jgi:hypothetical protein|nr:hypothetical protein [Chthoniobacter sp.]